MSVFLLPHFVVDLQTRAEAHFAKRVLNRTILRTGAFREDSDDHRYHGITGAWIRYVSGGKSAYRVIYIRSGSNVYLYRAGGHDIEDRLDTPKPRAYDAAIPLSPDNPRVTKDIDRYLAAPAQTTVEPPPNRFLRNSPNPDISRAIFSRRNLPHRDIWLVAPFITPQQLLPTAKFGGMLFDQVDDGASIMLITAPPKNQNITWLEQLEERNISVYFYPRLHSKLYCFVLDENRRYDRGLPNPEKLSSFLLIGSANMTSAGLALGTEKWNEELCYAVPDSEIDHIETYVTDLVTRGYGLTEVRALRARGHWKRLENDKW
ncbi:MAG: hypothetical protein OXC05_12035 [Halieaceae bacterium]|nr:hypothetical protein [Halieaceae bacterium]